MVKKLNLAGDEVYMKRDWLGWRQIYPLKNSDGSWNYPNLLFGGYRNLIFLVCSICYGVEVIDTDISFTIEPYEEFIQNQNP